MELNAVRDSAASRESVVILFLAAVSFSRFGFPKLIPSKLVSLKKIICAVLKGFRTRELLVGGQNAYDKSEISC